ncbi:hypothetical protein [Pleionea sediminis]|uniref:hypothetical protein n=1 Tax=Pleionea sediminis TaxID=2569479 RepID=UPI001186FD6C|nr:hypothetical protein [Pleionea sediminis]
MKKLTPLFVILGLIIVRAIYVQVDQPGTWARTWDNFKTSQSILHFGKDIFYVLSGKQIRVTTLPADEMERVIYQWKNDVGEIQTSFQRPVGVKNVKEIRLGDLDIQTEESMSDKERLELETYKGN